MMSRYYDVIKHAVVLQSDVVVHDFTSHRPFGQLFVVQRRILEHNPESKAHAYLDLTHEQRTCLWRRSKTFLLEIRGQMPCGGTYF